MCYADILVSRELLQGAANERDLHALQQIWHDMPRDYRKDSALVTIYAGHLLELHADDAAETVIREAMAKNWDSELAYLYGNLRDGDAARQLEAVENWLKQQPEDDQLLLTAAKLSMRNELWGKARSYVEASIGRNPSAESYQLLGLLCEKTEDDALAMAAYRKGLKILAGERDTPALPVLAETGATVEERADDQATSD